MSFPDHDFDFDHDHDHNDYQLSSNGLSYLPQTPRTSSESATYRSHQLGTRVLRSNSQRSQASHRTPPRSLSPQPSSRHPPLPSSPSPPSYSASESYLPGRLLALTPPARAYNGVSFSRPFSPLIPQTAATSGPVVRFDEDHLALLAADNAGRSLSMKDELAFAAGKVTPGVDDTPYIQYALKALTSNPSEPTEAYFPSGSSAERSLPHHEPRQNYPLHSDGFQDEENGDHAVSSPTATVVRGLPSSPTTRVPNTDLPPALARDMPDGENWQQQNNNMGWDPIQPLNDHWIPVSRDMRDEVDPHGRTHPSLTFKPRILRPLSMMTFTILCALMTAALIFTARYAEQNAGLMPYPGSIYSGQYFLFRILPQLAAAVLLLYAQSIVAASLRVLPFVAMASEDPEQRRLALFRRLYPKSFLRPQLVGGSPWHFTAFDVATWLSAFTLPLQSSAFTCVYLRGRWTWSPVQGVVWALVALYIILLAAAVALTAFWWRRWTGLLWDVRSIGDVVPLLNRSNAMRSYGQNGFFQESDEFKKHLHDRWTDRLGYWQLENTTTGGIWYAIGSADDDGAAVEGAGRRPSSDRSVVSVGPTPPNDFGRLRHGFLPWYLRNGPAIASVMVTGGLLLALLILAFLPKTKLEAGFSPLLSSRPGAGSFSKASFLYSFLPSFIGTIFFLLFQSVDQSVRVLQPWADLGRVNGASARKSILADYAASLPFQSTLHAARNGHWRVAALSLMSVLFVFIPVLAGGMFMALSTPDRKVHMYTSMPVFGVLLAFLFLYVGGLSLLIPRRGQFSLPHPVVCVAGIISFCSADDLTQDAAFRSVRSRRDLEGRLGLGRDPRDESVWFFGIVPGKDEQRLSVRRMKRFTEKRMTYVRSMV